MDRPVALKIASQEWEYVNSDKLPDPGTYTDFAAYVSEKIEMSLDVAGMKNRAGYIIKAIRENYQNNEVRKAREIRAAKIKEKALEDLADSSLMRNVRISFGNPYTPNLN